MTNPPTEPNNNVVILQERVEEHWIKEHKSYQLKLDKEIKERMERIRSSLEKINKLMQELKHGGENKADDKAAPRKLRSIPHTSDT